MTAMISTSPLIFYPLAMTGISWSAVLVGVVAWLLTTAATWLIAARVTTAVLREQNKNIRESVGGLLADVRQLSNTISEIRQQRGKCELRAVKTFATREEFAQIIIESAANHREEMTKLDNIANSFRNSVGKVHSRADALAERVTRLEAETTVTGSP